MNLSSLTQITTAKIAPNAITEVLINDDVHVNNKVVPVGAVMPFAMNAIPTGWLACNGTAVLISSYPNLAAAIYCGDALNATAGFGYKATSSAGTTRSTTGTFITIPDLRGIFVRGSGSQTISSITYNKTFGAEETDAMQGHRHAPLEGGAFWCQGGSNPDIDVMNNSVSYDYSASATGSPTTDGTNGAPRTASETRPANIALLYCIKF